MPSELLLNDLSGTFISTNSEEDDLGKIKNQQKIQDQLNLKALTQNESEKLLENTFVMDKSQKENKEYSRTLG